MAIKTQWKFRDIEWREVFKRQDYATLLLTMCFIVGLVIPYALSDPRYSAYIVYDATISLAGKDNFKPSVPNFVPVLVPLLTFAFTVVIGEFISSKSQHNTATEAVASALFFVLDGIQSFVCGLLVVQVTKLVVGRTRPDFLARCNPVIPANITITIGGDPDPLWPCQRPYDSVLKDGFQSFPSGRAGARDKRGAGCHTSTAFNLTVYASAYLIWCWHMRLPWSPIRLSMKKQFLLDLRNVAAKLWMLILLGVAWGIAISRMIDNQHHASDVIAGALIGICIALIYVLRAIPRYKRVLSPEAKSTPGDIEAMSV